MARRRFHTMLCAAALLLAAAGGCVNEENVLPEQQRNIESFLTGTHQPRLISEQEAGESSVPAEFYTAFGSSVFRYIRHYYDAERATRPEVEPGDEVELVFWAYLFQNRAITSQTMPLLTNDVTLREALMNTGVNTTYWSFEPLKARVGDRTLIRGVELTLPGCRERDTVEVYMAYDMAYGDAPLGTVPAESAVAFFYTIDSVRKTNE
ncbi:MAG: hypothetical protein K2O63_01260 [Alistipes sp.]|nr:hypothetical protein [Alistipes sp.]